MTNDGFTRVTLTDQLTERLRHDIANGTYPPGSVLPSEAAMIARHGVSRPVVRAAIAALTHEGLIRPVQGKGSYVRASAPELTITRTPGDPWAALLPEGERTSHVENATEFCSARFGVPLGSVLYRSEQTMIHPGTGRRFHTVRIVPSIRLEAIGTQPGPDPFQDRADLTALLTEHYGPLYETDKSEPRMPNPDYVALLDIPPGTPLSMVTRMTCARAHDGLVLMVESERANSEGLAYSWPVPPAPMV